MIMEMNTTTNTNVIVIEYSTKVDYCKRSMTHSDCQPMNQSVQAKVTKALQ